MPSNDPTTIKPMTVASEGNESVVRFLVDVLMFTMVSVMFCGADPTASFRDVDENTSSSRGASGSGSLEIDRRFLLT